MPCLLMTLPFALPGYQQPQNSLFEIGTSIFFRENFYNYQHYKMNNSDVEFQNTPGCLDQYMAPKLKIYWRWVPNPQKLKLV